MNEHRSGAPSSGTENGENREGVPPHPWTSRGIVPTGGLIGVGFAEDSDLLLILTHDGRGVVDCLSGTRVARDPDPDFPFDEETRLAQGIGPLSEAEIVVAGNVFGGSLAVTTPDGWALEGVLTNRSDDALRLVPPRGDASASSGLTTFTGFIPEVRAFGFSPTGRSFVIATGAEVFAFAR